MPLNSDYKDLFKTFNTHKVQYLVVGAYAVIYYTEPRYTKDIDVWVNPTSQNAKRVWAALAKFGAPLKNIRSEDFSNPDLVYQIGIEPNRIDVMMGISGVKFTAAWKKRKKSKYASIPINIIGIKDLAKAKKKANRDQDIIDLKNLRKIIK